MQAGKSHRFTIMSAVSMLMMLSCLGHVWAATIPLSGPVGLALDARGNLYVANNAGNQVLVYNPNYVQQTTKTITTEVSEPVGVAFDSKGNVYVANQGTGSVTQYSPAGVQNPNFSISGIDLPLAIAVDGVDQLYVSDLGGALGPTITVFPVSDTINGPYLLTTITGVPGGIPSFGIAVHGGDLYISTGFSWEKGFVSELLTRGFGFPVIQTTNAKALATDSAGDLYDGLSTNEVDVWTPKGGPVVFLQGLSFQPAGIVVDSARGRVYLSNQQGNQVLVYSTKGKLLHTIQ